MSVKMRFSVTVVVFLFSMDDFLLLLLFYEARTRNLKMPNIEENKNEKALLRKAYLEKIGSLTGSCEAAAGFSSDSEKAHDCARKRRMAGFLYSIAP